MPVCSFFLRGVCTKEDCPYLHVSVGRDAEVCPDFIKGYCLRGEKVRALSCGYCRVWIVCLSVFVTSSALCSTRWTAPSLAGLEYAQRVPSVPSGTTGNLKRCENENGYSTSHYRLVWDYLVVTPYPKFKELKSVVIAPVHVTCYWITTFNNGFSAAFF